ncbi:uncharacterized protein L199_001716 [Kwoniella botswanensis]|uniref:uncharacterized protein n=1 Tax=Kwoniella botswanensis TaxID=1268659 RepID=UPI00315CCA66
MEEYSSRPENQGGYRTRLILLWEDYRERKRSLNDQKRGKSLKERNDMGTAGKWSESHRLQRREWEKQYEREVRLVSGMNDSQQITTKSVAHSQTDQKNGISFGTMRPNTETFAVGFGDPLAAQNSSLSTHYTENLSWEITSGQSHYTQPINPGMEAGFNEMMVAGHSQSDCFGNLLPSDWSLFNPGVSNTGILSGSSIDFPNLNSDHDTYGNASQIVDMPEESFAGWQANDVIDFSLLDTQLEPDANPTPPEEQQGYEGYRSFR